MKIKFLDEIKRKGRCAPVPLKWRDFYSYIERQAGNNVADGPPWPLVLTADQVPSDGKLERLSEQLDWAMKNKCLDQALGFLQRLPEDAWQ